MMPIQLAYPVRIMLAENKIEEWLAYTLSDAIAERLSFHPFYRDKVADDEPLDRMLRLLPHNPELLTLVTTLTEHRELATPTNLTRLADLLDDFERSLPNTEG